MRRVLAPALVLVITGCAGQTPPPRSTLPDVGAVVEAPKPCTLLVGSGLGVEVRSVLAASPAEGNLEVGDLMVSLDGAELSSVEDLFRVMETKAVGHTIDLGLVRDQIELTVALELAANPDDPSRPMIGVQVSTAYREVMPAEVGLDPGVVGRLVRLVEVEGGLFVLDPLAGRWADLGAEVPAGGFQPASDRVLVLEGAGTAEAALRVLGGEVTTINGSTSTPGLLLGAVGDLMAVGAEVEPSETGTAIRFSVLGVDPESGSVKWEWAVPAELQGAPRFAITSPERERLLVVTSSGGESTDRRYVVLDSAGDVVVTNGRLEVLTGNPVFGWFSGRDLLFQQAEGGLALLDLVDGETSTIALPESLTVDDQTRLWTVGDGENVLVATRRTFVRANLIEAGEVRVLAERCQVNAANPGYGV